MACLPHIQAKLRFPHQRVLHGLSALRADPVAPVPRPEQASAIFAFTRARAISRRLHPGPDRRCRSGPSATRLLKRSFVTRVFQGAIVTAAKPVGSGSNGSGCSDPAQLR